MGLNLKSLETAIIKMLLTGKPFFMLFSVSLVRISVETQMFVPVYTVRKVIEKVCLSPWELSVAQWELCHY